MKRILLFCLALSLQAATYYVSSAGNDSTGNGTSGNPWLTLQKGISGLACGDTLIVVANGSYVAGDATLPYFANCATTTTIQSSKWNLFEPVGYRTNPTNDGPNYGKLNFTSGITVALEGHGAVGGSFATPGGGVACTILALTGGSTLSIYCSQNGFVLANDDEISFELQDSGAAQVTSIFDGALAVGQKVYVINCMSCATNTTGTFQISLTKGGSAITGLTCTSPNCQINAGGGSILPVVGLQVTAGSSTITSPYAPGSGTQADTVWQNGTPVACSTAGFQIFGTLPAPLQPDTNYYVVSLSGFNFGLAATPGGSAIVITNIGVGAFYCSNTNLPNNWAFRGLEMTEVAGNPIYGFIKAGTGGEASTIGMVHHFEVDHVYIHEQANDTTPPLRGIADNGRFLNAHDNYVAGMFLGESQAIQGSGSPGPTVVTNNFLEAAGENIIYGGGAPASGIANSNKLFQGNYFYKPPSIWTLTGTAVPTGTGWYDCTDPLHCGGSWYYKSDSMQWYQVGSDFAWHTTASTPNCVTQVCGNPFIKDLTEHKNGRYFNYVGNVYNYSPAQGQSGEAWNNSNEIGSGPGWSDDHITMSNNAVFHVYEGFVRITQCGVNPTAMPCINPPGWHIATNNLIVLDPAGCGVNSNSVDCGFTTINHVTQFDSGLTIQSDVYQHNTVVVPDAGWNQLPSASEGGGSTDCIHFAVNWNAAFWKNNIWSGDFTGACIPNGGAYLSAYLTNSTFSNNAFHAQIGNYSSPGATNSWTNTAQPTDNTVIKYVNNDNSTTVANYALSSSSPYSAANGSATLLSSDGTDLGADIDMVNMMTSGARTGVPNWDVAARLNVEPYSTTVIFRYQAPTSAACTATIYSAPARITGNVVATVADSAGSSISAATDRQLLVTGLSATTQYWYKLVCGSEVMPGTFTTRKSGSGNYPWSFTFNTSTAMRYSASASMSSPTNLGAATTQTIPVPTNTVLYAQVGTTGPITIVAAP